MNETVLSNEQRRRASDRGVAGKLHTPAVNIGVIVTLLLAIASGIVKFTLVSAKTDKNEENITRVERHISDIHTDMKEIRTDIKELLQR